jgi:uncharacterized membrane protein (GlpM family)
MLYFIFKALLSGLIVALVSEIAKRSPTMGGLLASLPLVSTLAMIWLWRETHEPERIAAQAQATFWYFLPSVPMFLVIPWLLRQGYGFWVAMGIGCALTMILYLVMILIGERFGLRL